MKGAEEGMNYSGSLIKFYDDFSYFLMCIASSSYLQVKTADNRVIQEQLNQKVTTHSNFQIIAFA